MPIPLHIRVVSEGFVKPSMPIAIGMSFTQTLNFQNDIFELGSDLFTDLEQIIVHFEVDD
jgi:hypothetical protein